MADGRVVIDTELNTQKAESEAKQLDGTLKKSIGSGAFKAGAKATIGAIATIGATAGIAGKKILSMASDTAQLGDAIDKNSQKFGLSAEAYQKWDYVAKISGTSIDRLKMGFKTLTNTIDSANKGNDKALEKFKAVGLSMDDIKNKSREQIFEDTIKGLQKVSDETERSALANKLLGRAGMELGPMLNSNSKSIDKLMKEAEDYGMIMSDKAVKASAKFKDSLTKMQGTMTGLKNRMTAQFLPALTKVTDGLALIFKGDTEEGLKKTEEGITQLTEGIIKALPKILKIGGSIVGSIARGIIENMPIIVNGATELVVNLASGIIGAMPIILNQIPLFLQSIYSAITSNASVIWQAIGETIQTAGTLLADSAPQIISAIGTMLVQASEWLQNNLGEMLGMGMSIITGIITGILQGIPNLIAQIPVIISNLLDALTNEETLNSFTTSLTSFFETLAVYAPDIIVATVDALGQIVDLLIDKLTSADSLTKMADAGYDLLTAMDDRLDEAGDKIWSNILKKGGEWLDDKLGFDIFKDVGEAIGDSLSNGILDKIQSMLSPAMIVSALSATNPVLATLLSPILMATGAKKVAKSSVQTRQSNYSGAFIASTQGKSYLDSISNAVQSGMEGMYVKMNGRDLGRVVKK